MDCFVPDDWGGSPRVSCGPGGPPAKAGYKRQRLGTPERNRLTHTRGCDTRVCPATLCNENPAESIEEAHSKRTYRTPVALFPSVDHSDL